MNETIDRDRLDRSLQQLRDIKVTREDVDTVLEDLAGLYGMDSLALDENNAAELAVDDEIELSLVYLEHLPGLVAAIPMPESAAGRPELLGKMLQANMSLALTHGGTFALVPPRKEPMLCRLIVLLERDAAKLDEELATFVELGKAWRDGLDGEGGPPEDITGQPLTPPGIRV